ncbi:hypothetical protein HPB50_007930 [Hyalomma asiaticum]|uniref:Uncharacterized protein n=1 Tax=Hyalomma asiaticum TaxID=266040 RepID=A0ACB7S650_HYAAI|nr:hypothetical protein HPB50_007930 [Hyalomma asiaticum]
MEVSVTWSQTAIGAPQGALLHLLRNFGRRLNDPTVTWTELLAFSFTHSWLCNGLRLVRLDMPSAVIRGDPLWLNCSFDLESDELYSVKWYKNNREFFRYLPNENPPGQAYKLSGVHVDVSAPLLANSS